jgi:hypothetical protein
MVWHKSSSRVLNATWFAQDIVRGIGVIQPPARILGAAYVSADGLEDAVAIGRGSTLNLALAVQLNESNRGEAMRGFDRWSS